MKKFFKTYIPFFWAHWLMTILNMAVILFHVLVITGLIPFEYVWGGQLESRDQMLLFESVSLLINLLIGWVLFSKLKPGKFYLSEKVANFILYGLAMLFLLNTIGNIFAEAKLEQLIATPLTLIAAICCFRLAIEKRMVTKTYPT